MKLKLNDSDGKLITYADAPEGLPFAPVEWKGRAFLPCGTFRGEDALVVAHYRERDAIRPGTAPELSTRRLPDWFIDDPNTPRRTP